MLQNCVFGQTSKNQYVIASRYLISVLAAFCGTLVGSVDAFAESWKYVDAIDPFTDRDASYVRLEAVSHGSQAHAPTAILFVCDGVGGSDAFVVTKEFISDEKLEVRYRFDTNPARYVQWQYVPRFQAIQTDDDFASDLATNAGLLIEVVNAFGQPELAQFASADPDLANVQYVSDGCNPEQKEIREQAASEAARLAEETVEELIAAAMEQAAVEDARLAAEAAEAAEIARVAAARQAESEAEQAARDAANASASRQINASIADNMDWPIFVRAQDQWKLGATVILKDSVGGIASVQVRILKAPASADPLQMRSVRDALERSIWASGPWPIPTEYYEDWLDIPEFVLCPPVNALTVSLAC